VVFVVLNAKHCGKVGIELHFRLTFRQASPSIVLKPAFRLRGAYIRRWEPSGCGRASEYSPCVFTISPTTLRPPELAHGTLEPACPVSDSRNARSFIVREQHTGTSNTTFSYRVAAKNRHRQPKRLAILVEPGELTKRVSSTPTE
jgi:hypothetical protein